MTRVKLTKLCLDASDDKISFTGHYRIPDQNTGNNTTGVLFGMKDRRMEVVKTGSMVLLEIDEPATERVLVADIRSPECLACVFDFLARVKGSVVSDEYKSICYEYVGDHQGTSRALETAIYIKYRDEKKSMFPALVVRTFEFLFDHKLALITWPTPEEAAQCVIVDLKRTSCEYALYLEDGNMYIIFRQAPTGCSTLVINPHTDQNGKAFIDILKKFNVKEVSADRFEVTRLGCPPNQRTRLVTRETERENEIAVYGC